ncbi:MAG: hypothetical protein JXR61_05490, partial [Prolixibacteraceae bacterium]|nr:hypothetical protein [Prolixibacteraceae bacterium]
MDIRQNIKKRLDFIYDGKYSEKVLDDIIASVGTCKKVLKQGGARWSEKDIVLITYGDSIIDPPKKSLIVL